ncbi:MAG: hypothetical protein F6K00_26785 [Leptolyngbya sp. SIOISBB]|nr:hypothetical protein [Leptolyngbya sp. SIOISBB]
MMKTLLAVFLLRGGVSWWLICTSISEQSIPAKDLAHVREAVWIPSFWFPFMLLSALILAILGMLSNITAVSIGVTILALMMNPMLTMANSIVTTNWKLYSVFHRHSHSGSTR